MFDVVLVNRTPFSAATHVQVDRDGQEMLLAVMCATFHAASDDAPLTLAETQAPVRDLDQPRGDPARSSIAFETDLAPLKPRVDVLVHGHATVPRGGSAGEIEVALRIADIDKRLRVTGDRGGPRDTPRPFSRLPLVYERAFGGSTPDGDCCRENPVGIGHRGASSADPTIASAVPNIAYADSRAASASNPGGPALPAGFGIVARQWLPRLPLAGTYDQHWLDTVWPLPPADFDPLFHQTAPRDQQTAHIVGGETVELVHMTPSGLWRFRLPVLDVPVHLIHADQVRQTRWSVDTVEIDADRRQVTLKARQAIRVPRQSPPLECVVLGPVTPAWLRARQQRKVWRPRAGVTPPPCFHP